MQSFTGTQWLKIDIANQMGHDKWLWEDRITWTEDHDRDLELLADKADKPLLYKKAVRALRDVQAGKPTNFIMGLDSTSSGIQLMSMISGCVQGSTLTNLVDPTRRYDVYTAVTDYMADVLKEHTFPRSDLKQAVMTSFYASTAMPKKIFGHIPGALEAFYKTVQEQLPGAWELLEIALKAWQPEAKHYHWVMPDGFHVVIPVTTMESYKLYVEELGFAVLNYRAEVVKAQPKGLSLAANLVHSWDAYVCREMIRKAHKQGFQLATVHK